MMDNKTEDMSNQITERKEQTMKDWKPKVGEWVVVVSYSEVNLRYGDIVECVETIGSDSGPCCYVKTKRFLAYLLTLRKIRPLRPEEVKTAAHARQFTGRKVRIVKDGLYVGLGVVVTLSEWLDDEKVWRSMNHGTFTPSAFLDILELLPEDEAKPEPVETFAGGFKVGDRVETRGKHKGTVVSGQQIKNRDAVGLVDTRCVPVNIDGKGIKQALYTQLTKIEDEAKPENGHTRKVSTHVPDKHLICPRCDREVAVLRHHLGWKACELCLTEILIAVGELPNIYAIQKRKDKEAFLDDLARSEPVEKPKAEEYLRPQEKDPFCEFQDAWKR